MDRAEFVHLEDIEEKSIIKQQLEKAGFSASDSEWLVDLFERPDCFGDAAFSGNFSESFERVLPGIVKKLGAPQDTEIDQGTRLALLFSFLLGFGPENNKDLVPNEGCEYSSVSGWVSEFQRHADFSVERLDIGELLRVQGTEGFYALIPFLFPKGVPLSKVVKLDLLDPEPPKRWTGSDFDNRPETLEFWLIWRFRDNTNRQETVQLGTLLPEFSDFSEQVLGKRILGLLNSIGPAMDIASANGLERLDMFNDGWRVVAEELIPFFQLLNEKHPETYKERSPLLKAWWHLSRNIFSWSMGRLELQDAERNKLVESAARHIGILRSVLRDTPEVFEDEDAVDFYKKAYYVLLVFALPWKCLKSLLLAFTEMKSQAVASHLGFWNEPNMEPPPAPYNQVPLWIGQAMYPQNLQEALERDPNLQELREAFAKFCLERLRTKKRRKDGSYTDADFVEPRAAWRFCYVQALAALRVNPGGRAHRTLFWLLNNDPDEAVKDAAQKAHKHVRHLDRGRSNVDEGVSPRRPLFEAFWWLRQAHLITLGIKIDRSGAMRTRRKELHRTREKDDRLYRRK